MTDDHLCSAINQMSATNFWEDEQLWQRISGALPGYRLSKFQPLMPDWVEQEVLFDYLLDRTGAAAWIRKVSGALVGGTG
ncbi:MAG: hypothetical protein ABIS50_00555 [Luteolibacter sp.]|uniref:hypothetical protein n=1 Tax=Luteolibacter sp. TaxID=1962973 RepID=UPI003262F44A